MEMPLTVDSNMHRFSDTTHIVFDSLTGLYNLDEVHANVVFQKDDIVLVMPGAPKSLGSQVLDDCTLAEVTLSGPVTVGMVLGAACRHSIAHR